MKNWIGKAYLAMAFSLAGTSVVTGRILSEKLGGFTITAVSLLLLLVCLLPFYFKQTVRTVRLLKREDFKQLLLQAAFGIFLFRAFLLFGVGKTSAMEAGILTGATPAITSLLAYFFLKERFGAKSAIGIACTVFGIILLQDIQWSAAGFSVKHLGGNLLVLGAASCESIFNVLSRKHKTNAQHGESVQIHPMVQTMLVSAAAFVFSCIPAVFSGAILELQSIGLREWLALVWYGLVVTAVAFGCFYAGVKRCNAYTTAAFSGLMPLTSMLLSMVLLHESITYLQWSGGLLVVLSMFLIGSGESAVVLPAQSEGL